MKKLMFLLVAGTMFVFTACNCGACAADCTEKCCAKDVVKCADDCKKACCLGCKAAEGGECLADRSCCAKKDDSLISHEGHDHKLEDSLISHEGHDH